MTPGCLLPVHQRGGADETECLFHAILVVDLHLQVSVWVAIKSNRSIVVVLIVVELREIDSALFHRVDRVVRQHMTGLEMLSERQPIR
jgi:hypothetical protein